MDMNSNIEALVAMREQIAVIMESPPSSTEQRYQTSLDRVRADMNAGEWLGSIEKSALPIQLILKLFVLPAP